MENAEQIEANGSITVACTAAFPCPEFFGFSAYCLNAAKRKVLIAPPNQVLNHQVRRTSF